MARFKFTLQRVLDRRLDEEEVKRRALATIERRRRELEDSLRARQGEIEIRERVLDRLARAAVHFVLEAACGVLEILGAVGEIVPALLGCGFALGQHHAGERPENDKRPDHAIPKMALRSTAEAGAGCPAGAPQQRPVPGRPGWPPMPILP